MTYEKIEPTEDHIAKISRILNGYSCIEGHRPLYTQKRLRELLSNNDTEAYYREDGSVESVLCVRFEDEPREGFEHHLLCWGRNTVGLETESDLRKDLTDFTSFLSALVKDGGYEGAYVRVQWKDYKPSCRFQFDNWQEIYEEVVSEWFEFEIDPDAYMRWEVK